MSAKKCIDLRRKQTSNGRQPTRIASLHYCSPPTLKITGKNDNSKREPNRASVLRNKRPSSVLPPRSQQQSEKSSSLGRTIIKNDDNQKIDDSIGRLFARRDGCSSMVKGPNRQRVTRGPSLNKSEIEQWERLIQSNDKSMVQIATSTSIESEASSGEWTTAESSQWSTRWTSDGSGTLLDMDSTTVHDQSSRSYDESAQPITRLANRTRQGPAMQLPTSKVKVNCMVKETPTRIDQTTDNSAKCKKSQSESSEVDAVPSTIGKKKESVTSRGDEASVVNAFKVQLGSPKLKQNWTEVSAPEDDDSFWMPVWSNPKSQPGDGNDVPVRQEVTKAAPAGLSIRVNVTGPNGNSSSIPPLQHGSEPIGDLGHCKLQDFLARPAPKESVPSPRRNLTSKMVAVHGDERAPSKPQTSTFDRGLSDSNTQTTGMKYENLDDENVHLTSDLTIIVEERKFLCHKFVLYKNSNYFRTLIQETVSQPPDIVELEDVPEPTFDVLYKYMYTGHLKVTHDNFNALLDTAQKLEMSGALQRLVDFMDDSFDATNAIFLHQWCEEQTVGPDTPQAKLQERAHNLLVSHFGQVVKSTAFLRLSLGSLLQVLRDDGITVASELDIFWAAHRWLTHQWGRRKDHIEEVMSCVRFALMSEEQLLACLQEVQRWKMDECPEMKDLMMEAMTYKMYQKVGHQVKRTRLNVTPRTSCITKAILRSFDASSTIDSEVVTSLLCNDLSRGLANVSAFSENDWNLQTSTPSILLVGGADPLHNGYCTAWQNKVHAMYLFDPAKEKWQSIGLSPKPWHHPGIAHLNGIIYVCGGSDLSDGPLAPGPSATAQAWCFNIQRGVWTQIPYMKTARIHHTVLTAEGKVYAIGGFDNRNRILKSVECYNPLVNRWDEMSAMPYECLGMAACEFQQLFWICGGIVKLKSCTAVQDNKGGISDMVQVYNPKKNKWYMSTPLRIPRAFASLSAVNDQLFLIGGNSPPKPSRRNDTAALSVSDIDVFNVTWNEWRHYTDLFLPRHCCGTGSIGNHLYIFGGMSTALGEVLTSVERFDTVHRKWVCLSAELPVKLAGMGCVVIPPTKPLYP